MTYSSDYFAQLHDLAVQLIKSGHAYVDHQTPEEVKASRCAAVVMPFACCLLPVALLNSTFYACHVPETTSLLWCRAVAWIVCHWS